MNRFLLIFLTLSFGCFEVKDQAPSEECDELTEECDEVDSEADFEEDECEQLFEECLDSGANEEECYELFEDCDGENDWDDEERR